MPSIFKDMKKTESKQAEKIKLFTLPNLLTLGNLIAGCLALVFTLRYNGGLQMAFYMVLLAAVFDFLDGFAARLLGGYSRLGVQLDSLCDMVSFGAVPAAILLRLYENAGGSIEVGYLVFVLAACAALRLAKFNIDERQHDHFIGLPTPAAALMVASFGFLFEAGTLAFHPAWIIVAAVVLSVLMISEIPMFALKFKNFGLRGNELRYGFLAVSAVLLILWREGALCLIIGLYILTSIVSALVCRRSRMAK